MGWFIFFICSFLAYLILVRFRQWKVSWYSGVITLVILYCIDAVLIDLGAYGFSPTGPNIGYLPLFYWMSSFFGGNILVYFFPSKKILQLPYIILSSMIFLLSEFIMGTLGYFEHFHWSYLHSFCLDIMGFISVIWIWQWIHSINSKSPIS